MERLVTVRDMMQRYGCSNPTARKYLRQIIPHMENPLSCHEWALREWEEKRTVIPAEVGRKRRTEILQRQNKGRIIVPRRREG